jgi:hypothetical protein
LKHEPRVTTLIASAPFGLFPQEELEVMAVSRVSAAGVRR